MEPKHPWQARLGVAIAMLLLAFLGMIVTDIRSTGGWDYWRWVIPIYALLALWLSWYIQRQTQEIRPITLWHELLHWVGLMLAVFMVSYYVHLGTVSRFTAGIFDLTLLSLAIFLAGIYIEKTFLLIGVILGLFALLSVFVVQYLYALMIPLVIAGGIIVAVMVWISHRKFKK